MYYMYKIEEKNVMWVKWEEEEKYELKNETL